MKTTSTVMMSLGAMLIFTLICTLIIFTSITTVEDKIEQLKPKETKTIEDYHNLIEESKEKIDEIAEGKWLRVSDVRELFTLTYSEEDYWLDVDDWQELLKEAEDAPQIIQWESSSPTYHSMVDVSIGITAEQIVEAFKSIDPNDLIRIKEDIPQDTFSDIGIILQ